jgi:urease accessory protein
MNLRKSLFAIALFLSPAVAFAHTGHDHAGLLAGLAHPLFGLDHLLAMLAVGLWAAQQSGAARWALPLCFVGSMLVGGLLGFSGVQIALMETGIAASVLAFGLLVAVAIRLPMIVAIALTALLDAHDLLDEPLSVAAYVAGTLVACLLAAAVGLRLGRRLDGAR